MLQELIVKDFAIIDSLNLSFRGGLNVLSGETGAGKSIIVGALGLLMGGRASAELIRTAKEEAVVEAVFDVTDRRDIKDLLLSWDMETGDDQLLIRRTISKTGKNRIFIGERLATIQMLSQIGGRLIDISGQYSQQLLLQTENHIDILDAFGGLASFREEFQGLYSIYQERAAELRSLLTRQEERARKKELLEFQNEEILKAHLSPQEEEELKREKRVLANAQNLYEKTYGVYAGMYEDENASLTGLKQNLKELESAAEIDSELEPLKESFESVLIILEDTAFSLRDYADRVHMDTGRLESLETRLDEIQRLKRKYEGSVEEILFYQEKIQKDLEAISGSSKRAEQLRDELTEYAEKLWALAGKLSKKRAQAGEKLKKMVEAELATIGMKKACFVCEIRKADRPALEKPESAAGGLNLCGMDRVEFYISTNQGEKPKPLSKIASGGEISRIVLAIKKILAGNYRVPTLLFDEVDAGIGGAVAEAVGVKLKEIAGSHQVLCITHLPQIACFGKYHYSVGKVERDGRTVTCVELLDDDARLDEISRMLGGKSITEKTKTHAREMLGNANGS
jgi:DNA repair protein RecN (Recombination protein N)